MNTEHRRVKVDNTAVVRKLVMAFRTYGAYKTSVWHGRCLENLVQSCPFTRVAHERRLWESDVFSPTWNSPYVSLRDLGATRRRHNVRKKKQKSQCLLTAQCLDDRKVVTTHSQWILQLLNYLLLTAVFTLYTDFKPGRCLGKVSFVFGWTVCWFAAH